MSSQTVELSVVVAVYNNAATLGELVDRLLGVLEPMRRSFELIFVDDGSRDRSLSILQERAAHDPRIRLFALVRNFGSQAAMCAALDMVRGRYLVSLDADLENCPEDIPALVEPLERGYDLVCGYREDRRVPWFTRRFPSWLMNAYIRRRTGTKVRDLGCGMRACQSWVIRNLESEGESRRLLTPVILRRARRIIEVPVRQGGAPKASGHSFLTLLGIAADYYLLTAGRPFLISGLVSAAAIVAGVATLLSGRGLAGLVITASGCIGGLVSLVGEYCQRLYQLGQGIPFYELRDLEEEKSPRTDSTADAG